MAAHDMDLYFPYDAGAGANVLEAQWRDMARYWLIDGPLRGELSNFAPSTTAGRNITVGAGRCWVAGAFGELSTAFTQPFATNASGNPRIDLVVLRNDFSANKVVLDVLAGTPAGSPAVPALTQNTSMWEVPLYAVTLVSGYTAIASTDWVDLRQFAQGRPPGGPTVVGCAASRTTNLAVASAVETAIQFDSSEDYDTATIHSLGTLPANFTIPNGMPGSWSLGCIATFEAAVTGNIALVLQKNGSDFRTLFEIGNQIAGGVKVMNAHTDEECVAGDIFAFYAYQAGTGSPQNLVSARATFRYNGPLA